MYTERLQILISKEQRRRWEQEARHRGASVASIVREAVDDRIGSIAREDRVRAVETIGAIRGAPYLPPEELERAIAESRWAEIEPDLPRGSGS